MDAQNVAVGINYHDSARSLSATPLNAHQYSRAALTNSSSLLTERDKIQHFSRVDGKKEAISVCDHDTIAWQNLEMQLMHATLQDKELSELCLQRAIAKKTQSRTLRFERKRTGSWSSLTLLLLGVVPASLFIFALACTIYSIKIVYPQ